MKNAHLRWDEKARREVFRCPVFSVAEAESVSPDGVAGTYSIINASSWAIVIPVLKVKQSDDGSDTEHFVLVRQWRHGAREESLEFPGGVIEKNETPREGAARELREETGMTSGRMVELGSMNPNPAIMDNKVYFFLAEECEKTVPPDPDEDEFIETETRPVRDVQGEMGKPPYIHALMAAALYHYIQYRGTA